MRCPACSTELIHERYEEQNVRACENCKGHLVDRKRLTIILDSRMESKETLERAAAESLDSLNALRCPKCADKMHKQPMGSPKKSEDRFWVDVCKSCDVLWFNGGELAQVQLNYESTSVAKERGEAMEEVKKSEPLAESAITSNPFSAAPEILMSALFIGLVALGVAMVALKLSELGIWAAICCLAFTAIGVFLLLQLIEETLHERIAAITLAVVGIAGAVYLAFF